MCETVRVRPGRSGTALWPDICLLCEQPAGRIPNLCAACAAALPPTPASPDGPVHGLLAAFVYAPPISTLIHWMKFQGNLAAALTLGCLLVEFLGERQPPRPEVLLPVPLHRARLRARGFNQSMELARPLARRWALPLTPNLGERTRATPPQSELRSPARRIENVAGAFRISPRGRLPESVAVVDDVVTTGATVRELTRTLRAAGVRQVQVWCCAKV